jgi:uncharacterized SAM-binding protein YcdF (DUF218 family)
MLNVLSKVVTAFISPLGTALALGLIALLIVATKRRRLALGLSAFAIFWLGLWSLPVASNWLREIVEGQPGDGLVADISPAQAIVILGGGVSPPPLQQARPNLGAAADRVWYGASLYHAGKAPVVVLSGGSDPRTSRMSEAEAMLWLLKDLGVPNSAVLMEDKSRTTVQNAQFTAAILKERGIEHILLVTSALHMRRATERFEAEGLTVTPAPTDFEAGLTEDWRGWIPDANALDGSARAMKEIAGRVLNR